MTFFNEQKNPQEQLESGQISYRFALKLTQLAYMASKRKLFEFYVPTVVLIALVLAGSKFLHGEGRDPSDYIGIPLIAFAFYSWFAVKFFWASKGVAYLAWVEYMFGPKTSNSILKQFMTGSFQTGQYDLIKTAKTEGEYFDSVYAKGIDVGHDA